MVLHRFPDQLAEFVLKTFKAKDRVEASRLIGEALVADREAITQIEAALQILDRS